MQANSPPAESILTLPSGARIRVRWEGFFARADIRADPRFQSLPDEFRAHYGWR